MNLDNSFTIAGYVGALRREGEAVFIRIVHKKRFFNKRTNDWEERESWFSISFFQQQAEAAERTLINNDLILISGDMIIWPTEGPRSRVHLNGQQFKILDKEAMNRRNNRREEWESERLSKE